MEGPEYPLWFVVRMTSLATRFGGEDDNAKFEMLTYDYVSAEGPTQAIMRVINEQGARGDEYRAYPVAGSAILIMELTVTAAESDGEPTPETLARNEQARARAAADWSRAGALTQRDESEGVV